MSNLSTRTEIQTYRGPADVGAPRLKALPRVRRVESDPPHELETERHDTDDRRLAAAGIVLAVRRGDPTGAQWRLDLPDRDGPERLQVTIPPDDVAAPALPAELGELIRGVTGGRPVNPVGRARTVRTVTRLLDRAGRTLAELVRDELTLATMGAEVELIAWTEVELRPEAAALVEQLEERLLATGLHPAAPAADDELDRMLRPVPRVTRSGRPGSAGAALVTYLAGQTDRLLAEELRVRRGEPDSVHQLRVAARRLRSALRTFRPLLDRDQTESLVGELREFARELSPARDAEVIKGRIETALAGLEPELLLGPVQAQVTRHFARAEAEAGAAVLSTLDGERYARLGAALEQLVTDPPLTKRARRKATAELPRLVARSARRLERAIGEAIDPDQEQERRDLATHAARKAGKRLRYATEVARPAVGKPAARFAKKLKALQTALGEHQDTVVSRAVLRELAAQAHPAGQNGFSFGVLHARDAALAARIEDRLPELWAGAWTRRSRRWLG